MEMERGHVSGKPASATTQRTEAKLTIESPGWEDIWYKGMCYESIFN